MKAVLKTGETIEITPNDDFCAAKYINKETSEYVFNEEIAEIINEESEKPMNQNGLEEEMDSFFETMPMLEHENIFEDTFKNIALHFVKWQKEQMMKNAVEGLFQNTPFPTICLDDCKDYNFKDGDKVRVIVLPKNND